MTTSTNTTTKAVKEPTNLKVRVNKAKKELVITVPLERFEMSTMVEANLDKYEETSNGNYIVGSTNGWEKIDLEGFEHIAFSMSATAKKKAVTEEKTRIDTLANQSKVAKEALTEMKSDAPTMDMQEYQEFLEFKKWKSMMNAAQK